MVGVKLTEGKGKAAKVWTVVGEDAGGWIIAPEEFGPVEHVGAAELASRFGTEATATPVVDEQEGWTALADASDDSVYGPRSDVRPLTPEQFLKVVEDES